MHISVQTKQNTHRTSNDAVQGISSIVFDLSSQTFYLGCYG
jgi:hypothetical protein